MSLFHAGDLHSGISRALQNSLPVVIFVRDDGVKSQEWEEAWLGDETIHNLLSSSSVVLRIQAGSQEEAFLASFCKWSTPPSILVIRDGRTSLAIGPETTRQDFEEQLRAHFNAYQPNTQSSSHPSAANVETASTEQSSSTPAQNVSVPTPSATPPSTSTIVAQDTPRNSPHPAKGKGKSKAMSSDQLPHPSTSSESTAPPPKTASQMDWLEKQRQRQLEARTERERIMASIEADKAERRAEQERKRQARLQAERSTTPEAPTPPPLPSGSSRTAQTQDARLSVKLLSGSTIRATFPATATVEDNVRSWIGEAEPELGSTAYSFKQILAPAPARGIGVGEERLSLHELGFVPSATLVLVPVTKPVSEAYAASAGGMVGSLMGLPWSVASGVYGVASSVVGGMAGAVGGVLGYGAGAAANGAESATTTHPSQDQPGADDEVERGKGQVRPAGGSSGIRIRTLADQRAEGRDESNRWYNGNQLSFQPNEDIGDEE